MLFNSIGFLCFLPIVFVIYWIVPQNKMRIWILFIASYFFYMCWNPKYILLIIFTTSISYIAGRLIEKQKNKKIKRIILVGVLVCCLGVLFVFKYINFFAEVFWKILGPLTGQIGYNGVDLLLPVGISFYTFQTLSYVIDIYREDIKAERNFIVYATYISFFPQLVAGPIERTGNLLPQIKKEKIFDYEGAIYASRQILWGYFKKIAVADTLAQIVDRGYANLQVLSNLDFVIIMVFFSIQIYCDFSGYSDIAIGVAKLFGVDLMKNFKTPYFAQSMKEFWGRWHISLSTWFRDYLYIPLGGSRCSRIRTDMNLLITFLVSGLWHGANYTYILWGGLHGLLQIIEKRLLGKFSGNNTISKVLQTIMVFGITSLLWIIFRAESIEDVQYIFGSVIQRGLEWSMWTFSALEISKKTCVLIIGVIIVLIIFDYMEYKRDLIEVIGKMNVVFRVVGEYVLIMMIMLALILGSGGTQFVYFQF